MFIFGLVTGMRPEEYLGLQWKDIDLTQGTATVRRALCWHRAEGRGWYFTEPKTAQSRRTISLPYSVLREMADHRRQQGEERLRLGPESQNHGLVFATERATPLSLDNLRNRHFKPILKGAGLPSTIRIYDLRHSCATLLLEAGENPKVVSERLGHASIVLTLDTYSHVLPCTQKAAAEKLDKILFGNSVALNRNGEHLVSP